MQKLLYLLCLSIYLNAMNNQGINVLPRDCKALITSRDITTYDSLGRTIQEIKKWRLVSKEFKMIVSDVYHMQMISDTLHLPAILIAKHLRSIPTSAALINKWADDILSKVSERYKLPLHDRFQIYDFDLDPTDHNIVVLAGYQNEEKEKTMIICKQNKQGQINPSFGQEPTASWLPLQIAKGMVSMAPLSKELFSRMIVEKGEIKVEFQGLFMPESYGTAYSFTSDGALKGYTMGFRMTKKRKIPSI